ncbi:MAG TPA: hypothetical protein PK323_13040 [Bacteroidia bacterium]|nr:hypothetical protein [Bacteroidia bacterium]
MLEKKLYIILTLFLLGNGSSFAQSKDSLISVIIAKFQHIESHLKNYNITLNELFDESIDGGQISYYHEGKNIRLIEIMRLSDTGKRETKYYFDNEKLIFAIDAHYKYNRPLYWDINKAKEFNDTIIYDPSKTNVKEDRYYFSKEKVIGCIANDQKELDKLNSNLRQKMIEANGQRLITEAYKFKDKLKR